MKQKLNEIKEKKNEEEIIIILKGQKELPKSAQTRKR